MKIIRCLLCLFIAATSSSAQQKSDHDYTWFHQAATDEPSKDSGPVKTIGEVKWKFKTGGRIFSSPSLSGHTAFIGSEDGNLYATDGQTGKLLWKFTTGGAVRSTAAVFGQTVYFGSMDGNYYALNERDGSLKWKFKTGGEKPIGGIGYWGMKPPDMQMNDLWDYFLSSPVPDENDKGQTLYFGSSDGNVYAVNTNDGSLKWKFKTGGIIHSSPVLQDGVLFIGSWDNFFYAIDVKTGQEKWKFKTGEEQAMSGIMTTATVRNGVVYFGARDAHVYALHTDDGKILWSYDAEKSWILGSAIIKNDILYVGTSDSYLLLGLDTRTGTEKFRFKTCGYVFGSPAIAGNTLFIGDFTGKMYALDLASPGRYSEFSTASRKQFAAGVLKNDVLDFAYASKGADLYYYDANKRVMDDFYSLGPFVSSPAIKDNTLYVGSADGYLYALELK